MKFGAIFISVILFLIFGMYSCVDRLVKQDKEVIRQNTITWAYVGNTYIINGDTLDVVGISWGSYVLSNGVECSQGYIKGLDPIKGERY